MRSEILKTILSLLQSEPCYCGKSKFNKMAALQSYKSFFPSLSFLFSVLREVLIFENFPKDLGSSSSKFNSF